MFKVSNSIPKRQSLLLSSIFASGLLLQGCSTLDSGIEKMADFSDSVEESLQSAFVEIEVTELSDQEVQKGGFGGSLEAIADKKYGKEYRLSRSINDTIQDLDNRALHAKSRTLCEQGYVKLSEQAITQGTLKENSLDCVSGNCKYQLNWHIRCQDIPEQPFTFFGKT
ncbi:hypothetical protein [Thiomicrorhabdus indica]|uniref:hypothetical protein n=1 Tax=Thiomicrorhabdus indica TaxID=2267253 RepID=UPI00102E0893|nr:hypothetical protein [Thiomicrorhabdus indica]